MRAAMLYGVGDLRIETADIPEIKPNWVLIRVHACGVCPSDTRIYSGIEGKAPPAHFKLPRIPGHEWAGEIVQVGADVKNWKIGDRVVFNMRKPCGVCYYCQHGLSNKCVSGEDRSRPSGGFCEYAVGVDGMIHRIPDNVSYEEASFAEPLSCCVNGSKQANIQIGDDVVVIGTGQIGLMHIQLAKASGARVIAVDRIASRLEVAAKLGASVVIDGSKEDAIQKVKELTDGRGADSIILAVGSKPVADMGIKMVRIGGTVVFFASTHPESEAILPLDMNELHWSQAFLTGAHNYTTDDYRIALKYIFDGTVKVKPLISHYLPLEETKQGFDITVGRKGLKVMIQINK